MKTFTCVYGTLRLVQAHHLTQIKRRRRRKSFLTVQWLRPYAPSAWGMGSVPGWGTTIPHATGPSQNKQTATKTSKTKQNKKPEEGKEKGGEQ